MKARQAADTLVLMRRAAERYFRKAGAYCRACRAAKYRPLRTCAHGIRATGQPAWARRGLPDGRRQKPSGGAAFREHPVDQPPVDRLLRGHEVVAVQGPFHVRLGAPAMLGIEPDDAPLGFLHLGGMDQDVGRLALKTAERLMH